MVFYFSRSFLGCLFKTTTEEKKTFKPSISEGYPSKKTDDTFCVNGFVYIFCS